MFDRKLSFNKGKKSNRRSSPHNYSYGNSCSLQPFIGESVSSSMAYNDNSNRPLYVLKLKIFKVFNIYRSSNTYKTWRKLIFKTGQGSGYIPRDKKMR